MAEVSIFIDFFPGPGAGICGLIRDSRDSHGIFNYTHTHRLTQDPHFGKWRRPFWVTRLLCECVCVFVCVDIVLVSFSFSVSFSLSHVLFLASTYVTHRILARRIKTIHNS